jgi:hypothetical protein
MAQQESDFDPRVYGFSRLRPLIEEIGIFELEERPGAQGHKHLWLRNRRSASGKSTELAAEDADATPADAGKASKRGRRGGRKKAKSDKAESK